MRLNMNEETRKKYSFLWKIEDFTLDCYSVGEFISSPSFICGNLNFSKWYVRLFPKGGSLSNTADHLSVSLYRDNDEKDEELLIDYKMDVIVGDNEHLDNINEKDITFKGKQSRGPLKIIEVTELNNKVKSWEKTILTISCELSSKQVDKLYSWGCDASDARTKIGHYCYNGEWDFNISKTSFSFYFLPITINIQESGANFITVDKNFQNFTAEPSVMIVRYSVFDTQGVEWYANNVVCANNISNHKETWKCPSILSISGLLNKKSSLLLKAEISFLSGAVHSTITYKKCTDSSIEHLNSKAGFLLLHENLKDMLLQKKYCDVNLRVENKIFPSHKVFLAARSEVFSRMFEQDMLESKTGTVDIEDISEDTMSSFLEFIYTGSVKEMNYERASMLLMAADKYQVLSLIEKCSTYLKSVFSETNVCYVLAISELIGCKTLKTDALDYIQSHSVKVMSSPEWSKWVEKNNKLATDIILLLSNNITRRNKTF